MERKMVELEDTGLTFATEVDLERLRPSPPSGSRSSGKTPAARGF